MSNRSCALISSHPPPASFYTFSSPERDQAEFVHEVLEATDENKDGLIQVGEMMVLLRNIYAIQPLTVEEVRFIMERDLDMEPDEHAVPLEKVKQLMLEVFV